MNDDDDTELDKWALGTAFGCTACVLQIVQSCGRTWFLVVPCDTHRDEYNRRKDPRRGLQIVPDEPA